MRVLFNIEGTAFELHECLVDTIAPLQLGSFVTEREALALPFQLPPTGNYLYYTRKEGVPELAVAVVRDLDSAEESARYAESLMQMLKLQGPIKKGKMKGTMHAFGYRRGL